MSRFLIVAITIVHCLCLAGCRDPGEKRPMVFAAASTIGAMEEVLAEYRRQTGRDFRVSYGSSSSLARLMIEGADADVFLSANIQWVNIVAASLENAETVHLLGNELVLITQTDSALDIQHLNTLESGEIRRIAMADPNSVPAGIYARQHLESRGYWAGLKDKIAATADVRQALALVEQGAAQAGFVYSTDALASKKVRVMARLPQSDQPVIYPLLWRNETRQIESGSDIAGLVEFMMSRSAAKIFVRHGFTTLKNETSENPMQ